MITGNGEDVTCQRSLLLGLYVGSIGDVTSISDCANNSLFLVIFLVKNLPFLQWKINKILFRLGELDSADYIFARYGHGVWILKTVQNVGRSLIRIVRGVCKEMCRKCVAQKIHQCSGISKPLSKVINYKYIGFPNLIHEIPSEPIICVSDSIILLFLWSLFSRDQPLVSPQLVIPGNHLIMVKLLAHVIFPVLSVGHHKLSHFSIVLRVAYRWYRPLVAGIALLSLVSPSRRWYRPPIARDPCRTPLGLRPRGARKGSWAINVILPSKGCSII